MSDRTDTGTMHVMRITHERDLLRALLDLNDQVGVAPFLEDVVALARAATGARTAYLAIGPGFTSRTPRWWTAHSLDGRGLDDIRERVSRTVMQAVAEGGVLHSIDASGDARFQDVTSVQHLKLRSFLGVALRSSARALPRTGRPSQAGIGFTGEAIGLLYLSDADTPGGFDAAALDLVPRLARHLGPIAERLLLAHRGDEPDPTELYRARLKATGLVGHSPLFAEVLKSLAVAAAAPVTVMLTGASGTGKSLIARVLHDSSEHRGPFVTVNAAHLQPTLALAELFGARKGAYTGLDRDRRGLVEEAERGTLFIDEVTELPAEVQAQLLVFLQDGRYRPLGQTDDRQSPGLRIVTATNAVLPDEGPPDALRADLWYRLASFRIRIPSLDERPEDIVPLAFAIVDRVARRYEIRARPLSTSACAWLESQRWPGNVRQLENILQAGLLWAHSQDAAAIRESHLQSETTRSLPAPTDDLRTAVERFRRVHVQRVLDACAGNKSEAARRLGIHRGHIYDLLKAPSAPKKGPPDDVT